MNQIPQNKQDLQELATAVCALLPQTWRTREPGHESAYPYIILARADGLELALQLGGYRKQGRITADLFLD